MLLCWVDEGSEVTDHCGTCRSPKTRAPHELAQHSRFCEVLPSFAAAIRTKQGGS